MWIKIFLKVYAIMQRLKYFHDFFSFLSLQHKAQVIFFFFFFRPVWNYYTFQEVWYASKMNYRPLCPDRRLSVSTLRYSIMQMWQERPFKGDYKALVAREFFSKAKMTLGKLREQLILPTNWLFQLSRPNFDTPQAYE